MYIKTIYTLLSATLALPLVACSTATPQTASLYAPKVVVTGPLPATTVKPVIASTGTYPTFGPPLTAANQQLDDTEAVRIQTQIAGLAASHRAGQVSDAAYQKQMTDLRLLAATHAAAMQSKIAN
nr:hypothetical protein [uncultured Gellertiella sp.]